MAHANPEFALGRIAVRAGNDVPSLSFGRMRAEIARISRLVRDQADLTLREAELWRGYCAGIRRIREADALDHTTSLSELPAGGMHAGAKLGERFDPPTPRLRPVQAGRPARRSAGSLA